MRNVTFRENAALAVQKRLNLSSCRMEWWVAWAQGVVYKMGVNIDATWQIRLYQYALLLSGSEAACSQMALGNLVLYE